MVIGKELVEQSDGFVARHEAAVRLGAADLHILHWRRIIVITLQGGF